jgi:hypothetical protein
MKGLIMTRLEALQAAKEYVAETLKEKNEKGYPLTRDTTLEARISQELKVANWLMGDNDC